MNNLKIRILEYGEKIDMNLQNISEQINRMKKLINERPSSSQFINEYDDEDDEDDFDDGVWIELPFTKTI